MADPSPIDISEILEQEGKPKLVNLKLVMDSSLTKTELDEYNKLSAEGAAEKASQLKTIHLEWQNIGEIANLEPFESAEVLYMQYNRIARIDGLDSLPCLQFLALQHNRIKKIENLLCLTALEFLDLSKNQIEELDEQELPETINMLNLKENLCAGVPNYRKRLFARLPDLGYLDGEEVQALDGTSSIRSESMKIKNDENVAPTELLAGEKGLSAYWRKDELQSAGEADIAERINAYSLESLADVTGFGDLVANASDRSKARRDKMEKATRLSSSLRDGQLAAINEEQQHFVALIKEKEQLAARLKENTAAGLVQTVQSQGAPAAMHVE